MKFNLFKSLFSSNKKVSAIDESNKPILDLKILELLIEIARIDGEMTIDEIALIKSFVIKSFDLDMNLLQSYIDDTEAKTSLSENISIIKSNLTKEEILEVIYELFQLSLIDEDIHIEEERLIYKIADLLGVKRHEITKIKNRVIRRSI